jgi:hypothetical protein
MKSLKVLGIALMGAALSSSAAFAKTTDRSVVTPLPRAVTLADNVVVTPQGQAPAPAPSSTTTVVPAPTQPVVVEPTPAPAPAPRKTVVTESAPPRSMMGTIAVSALMGALAGGLIGGAIYFLDDQENPERIGYWAAGGVLVGTGIGIINVVTDESRAERAVSSRLPRDPVPTFRLSLLQGRF